MPFNWKNFYKNHGQEATFQKLIQEKIQVEVKIYQTRLCILYLHMMIEMDGVQTIIAEDVNERYLLSASLDEIEILGLYEDTKGEEHSITGPYLQSGAYHPTYSKVEIGDFISAVRAVEGREVRLILKLKNHEIDLNPEGLCFSRSYMTTNLKGEKIWATSVEKGPKLLQWLYENFSRFEILDPKDIEDEILKYYKQTA